MQQMVSLYRKWNTDSMEDVCSDGIKYANDDTNIDNDIAFPSLSPITTIFDQANACIIHNTIPELLEFECTSPYSLKQLKTYFVKNFTNFHPDKHNISHEINMIPNLLMECSYLHTRYSNFYKNRSILELLKNCTIFC